MPERYTVLISSDSLQNRNEPSGPMPTPSIFVPITIREALDDIHNNRYLLPAIQRKFVWWPHNCRRRSAPREPKALSPDGNPEFATVLKVMRARGLRLHASSAAAP